MSAAAAAVARTPVRNLRRLLPPASGVASSGTAISGVVASSSSCSIILGGRCCPGSPRAFCGSPFWLVSRGSSLEKYLF